jgi:pimeloyl-ACP methyl ester carboxylesterase
MAGRSITTADGFQLGYERHGTGPPLLLLHGFSHDRSLWTTAGWIEALAGRYTVLTVDLRGCGASTATIDPADYTLDRHVEDIRSLLQVCGYSTVRLFGWSFGGTLGLHLLAHLPAVAKAVIAGTTLGRVFTEQRVLPEIAHLTRLRAALASGRLPDLDLTDGWRAFLARTNLDVYMARLSGCMTWPAIQLEDLTRPLLLYTGTADHNVIGPIQAQQASLQAAGVTVRIFDGLSHRDLVAATTTVAPVVVDFLAQDFP